MPRMYRNLDAATAASTPPAEREQLIREIEAHLRFSCEDGVPLDKMCLEWAIASVSVLMRHGIRAVLQAGSMQWRFRDRPAPEATHFSFMWQPDHIASRLRREMGDLMEVHIWAAIPDRLEILDATTRYFKGRCEKELGMAWERVDPPRFLWATVDELKGMAGKTSDVRYDASRDAIEYIYRLMTDSPQTLKEA